jgi:thioredoxin reductase (NADPH)
MFDYDAIVIGAGPGGLTAALYLARGNFSVCVISEKIYDAQVGLLEMVENYPGFPDGVSGAELIDAMVTQASCYGAELETDEVTNIAKADGGFTVCCKSGARYTAKVVMAATGSRRRKLNVPGETELEGRGVFSCAFCDGGNFVGKAVAVVGGGDAGVTEALYLSRLCSHVYVLEMLPKLNASAVLQDRLFEAANMTVRCSVVVEEILGAEAVSGLRIKNEVGESEVIAIEGVLVDVGLLPNTNCLAESSQLEKDGRVVVDQSLASNVPGLFALGDIRSASPGQISSAVGDGATAGIAAVKMLQTM